MTKPMFYIAGSVAMSYVLFLGQIAIHNCVHGTLFRRRHWNRVAGVVLASVQLANYEGWRAAHLLHHRFTNSKRDPYRIELPAALYIVTQYFRHVREFWNGPRYLAAIAPPLAIAAAFIAWRAREGRMSEGILAVASLWLIPTAASHILVGHFNYITHVGLPEGRLENTRSFRAGIWCLINKLTFNFYLHHEHHLNSGEAVPKPLGIERKEFGSVSAETGITRPRWL